MNTKHAEIRAQQRAIPPLVDQWLDDYGCEEYDGHGGIIIFFNKDSRKKMERDFGHRPVALFSQYLNTYKVNSMDGHTITVGHRTCRIWHK